MIKKNGGRFLAALVCTAFIVFSGCPNATDPKVTPETPAGPTLAEQVVDELGASLSGSSASGSARSARAALSEDKIVAIKTAALAKITTDGYASSDKLDQILPSMIEGVKIAVTASGSGIDVSTSAVFETTAKSALSSLGKEERKTKLSSGVKLEAAVGTVTSVAVKVAVESVPEAQKATIVIAVSSVSVQIVATNAVYAPVADAAVKAAVTRSMETAPSFKAAIVEGSVKGALSGDSGLTEAAKKILVTASVDAAITAAGSDGAAVSMVVTASTKAVVTASGTGTGATTTTTTFVAEIAKQVTVTVQEENISLAGTPVAEVITTAVTDAGVTDTAVTNGIGTIVTEVQSEVAPLLSAVSSVAGGTLFDPGLVTLTASVSNTADKTPVYTWVQVPTSAPTVALSSTTAASVTLTPSASGTYTFKVTAMFEGGFKKSEAFVTFKADFTSGESGKKVAEGIANLKAKKFDEALTSFTAAYDLDHSNNEAVFWAAFLRLASISVDSDTVSLMKDRIGVANYPSTMNEVVALTWMTDYYGTESGFVPASSSDSYLYVRGDVVATTGGDMVGFSVYDENNNWSNEYGYIEFVPSPTGTKYASSFSYNGISYGNSAYSDYTDIRTLNNDVLYERGRKLDPFSGQLLPELKPAPKWASTFLSASNVYGDGADGKISSSSYFTLLMINLISNNPDGLNAMIDAVLAGPFGERLDSVVALIDALPDSTSVEIPLDLIQAYDATFQAPFPITIRKAELKAMSASLQMSKSFVQLIASYNLNYPLSFAQNAFWTTDGMTTMMEALFKQNNPVKAGFMGDRSQATRDVSKATLLAAIDDMQDAVNLLLADMATEGTIAAMARGQMGAEAYAEFKASVDQTKAVADAIETTLRNNTPLYINPAAMNGGDITALISPTATDGFIPVNFSKLYTTDILNPAKLLESTAEGLVFYTVDTAKSSQTVMAMKTLPAMPASGSSLPEAYGLFVKVMKARVQEVATIPADFLSGMPTDTNGNFYVPLGSVSLIEPTTYVIADWLR